MKTKFIKFDEDFPSAWVKLFHAGDAWRESLELIKANRDAAPWAIFWVEPSILAFTLELYIKALIAHETAAPLSKEDRYSRHHTSMLIRKYKGRLSIFEEITNDQELMDLITEYEKTIDLKYGEMGVQVGRDEANRLLDLIYKLRDDMCKRTGLR